MKLFATAPMITARKHMPTTIPIVAPTDSGPEVSSSSVAVELLSTGAPKPKIKVASGKSAGKTGLGADGIGMTGFCNDL